MKKHKKVTKKEQLGLLRRHQAPSPPLSSPPPPAPPSTPTIKSPHGDCQKDR